MIDGPDRSSDPAEDEASPSVAASSPRFWIVAGALAALCVLLVVAIVLNLPLKDSIAHAQASLREAQRTAERVGERDGSFAGASAGALAPAHDPSLVRGDEPSTGPAIVSVHAEEGVWAAAAQARPDACFYVRLELGGAATYGAGTACTGDAALGASEDRW